MRVVLAQEQAGAVEPVRQVLLGLGLECGAEDCVPFTELPVRLSKGKTDLVKLAKGEHLKLRFGILLHPGDVKEGKVAQRYKEFVDLKK